MHFLRFISRNLACTTALTLQAAVSVSVAPATATVNQGATQTFKATVTGSTNTAVTWSVTSGGGSISTSGVYTAPAKAGTYTVTATSKADSTKKAAATVTVPSVSVSVSPASVSLAPSKTQTFAATVTGSSTTGVTWSVSSGGGSITTAGVYTAPSATGTYTVTATSTADTTKKATASVTVSAVSVTLSPISATVAQGGTQAFTATVTGSTNAAVTWTVTSPATISSSGVFTAPSTAGTYTVTATSQADATKKATATVTVPSISLSVSPATATVAAGATQSFSATVTGAANAGVSWSVTAPATITSAGLFTAPSTPGAYVVTATSVADGTKKSTATVTVPAPPQISVALSPTTASLACGSTQVFKATVSGNSNTAVTWSVTGGSANGTITASGIYTAPSAAGTYTVVATSVADPTKSASATLTVSNSTPIRATLTPAEVTIAPGSTQPLQVTFTGGTSSYTYSCSGGSLQSLGGGRFSYTAPSTAGDYTVTVKASGTSAQAMALVHVVPGGGGVNLAVIPPALALDPGSSQAFSALIGGTSNTAATWSVAGGQANGTISSAGLYSAPTAPGTYSVTATSTADPSKTATAMVTVQDTTPVRVSLAPSEITLPPGKASSLQVTLTGTTGSTSYQYSASAGTLASGGSGVLNYTAPSQPGDATIKVAINGTTSQAMAVAHVVTPPSGISVMITQSAVTVAPGQSFAFTATVSGTTTTDVTWTVVGGDANGTFDASLIGTYYAPETAGIYTVVATSVADPTKKATAIVTVPVTVSLDVYSTTLNQGDSTVIYPTVTGASDPSVIWSSIPSGLVDQNGQFFAPATAGTYTIIATSVADPSQSASLGLKVPPVTVSAAPTTITVMAGNPLRLGDFYSSRSGNLGVQASVKGAVDATATWSVVSGGGSVAADPSNSHVWIFSAPFATGICTLMATSLFDPTKTVIVTVTVTANPEPVIQSFTANPIRIPEGGSSQLSGIFGNGPGVVTPGGLALAPGAPLSVTPIGTTAYVLTVTGSSGDKATATQEVVATGPGAYSPLQPYPAQVFPTSAGSEYGVSLCSVTGRDGQLYTIGGCSSSSDTDMSIYRLNMADGSWTRIGALPNAAGLDRFSALALPNGKLLIVGALWIQWNGGWYYTEDARAYVFDPMAGAVTRQVDYQGGIGWGANLALLPDGQVLVTGGKSLPDGTTYCNGYNCWVPRPWACAIDPDSLNFSPLSSGMNHARADHASIQLQDGRVLIAGGGDPTVEVFDPAAQTFTAVATLQASWALPGLLPDGRVLLLKAGPGEDAILDPSTWSLTYASDAAPDAGTLPLVLPNGLVLADASSSDLTLWDPVARLRLGVAAADSYHTTAAVSMAPAMLTDGTVVAGRADSPRRFDVHPALTITPAFAQENAGRPVSFSLANLNGASTTWSASGGSIDAGGHFMAPAPGIYHVTATTSDGRMAIATVNAWPAVKVKANPIPPVTHGNGNNWFQPGDRVQLTATVSNTPDSTVNWSASNDASGISITPGGQLTAFAPGQYSVLASSTADPSAKDSLTFWVWPSDLQPPQVSLVQASPTKLYQTGGQVAFSWQTTGWSVDSGGVSQQLLYYSPGYGYVPVAGLTGSQGVVEVPAATTSIPAGAHQAFSYAIQVRNPAGAAAVPFEVDEYSTVSVRVSPTSATLFEGSTQHFFASLVAPTARVSWAATGGTIDQTGNFSAPFQTGTFTVTATSLDDPAQSASALVAVQSPNMTINPSAPQLAPGQIVQLVVAAAPSIPSIVWSTSSGTIDGNGLYTAPSAPGTYTITAASAQDPSTKAQTIVEVVVPQISIAPRTLSLYPGQGAHLGYSVSGLSNPSVHWLATGGTVDAQGNYQAPTSPGTYMVSVISDGSGASASCSVTVNPLTLQVTPSSANVAMGSTIRFGYSVESGAVTWSTTGGTISPSGVYTPPAHPGVYTVTATSTVNAAFSAVGSVTVTAPIISLTPSEITLPQGGSYQFTFSSSAGSLNWLTTGGDISPTGVYTAPMAAGTYTVTATNSLDPDVAASASVTVILGGEKKVTIQPGNQSLFPGGSAHFSATVAGLADSSVSWSVVEPNGGSVDAAGVYAAPLQAGVYTLQAASVQDPTVKGTATIQVSPVIINPQPNVLLAPLFTKAFTGSLAPGASGPILWSIDEGSAGGQITRDGLYSAPATNGIVHVRAALPGGGSDSVEVDIGQIEDVVIGIPVQVTQPGSFRLSADLIGSNGKTVSASLESVLPAGSSTPELTFPARDIHDLIGVDGPWTVGNVQLDYLDSTNGEIQEADSVKTLGMTQAWQVAQLQQPWAAVSGDFSSAGVKDSSGALLGLQANVGVKLLASGTYTVFALLMDANGNEVACSGPTDLVLPAGSATVTLAFPGASIKASGSDGPYTVTDLVIAGQESDAFQNIGVIIGFKASDFQ